MAEAWLQHTAAERAPEVVAAAVGLAVADVERALACWAEYRDEIDDIVTRHQATQNEALAAWERRRALDAL